MNKTEKIKHLTKSVIHFMDALGYMVVNDESGRIMFSDGSDVKNYIEYSRGDGSVCIENNASPEVCLHSFKLEKFITIVKQGLAM